MLKYLVFDTETSGLPDYAAPADDPNQPRLAEFAGITVSFDPEDGAPAVIATEPYLVKPDGWVMEAQATAVNGLTTEYLIEHGKPLSGLLAAYVEAIKAGCIMVAFNARHDLKVMRGELRRAGMEDMFEQTPNICLMRSSWQKALDMRKADGSRRGWPALTDACRHFGLDHADDHRAASGARNALGVFLKLREIGMLLPAEIHYAKNKPQPDPQGSLPTMDF